MATTFKRVPWANLGTVLTTQLDALANGAYSAFGTAYDNSSGLYEAFALDIVLASLNPTTGAFLQAYMGQSLNGTNYDDPPSSTNPGLHMAVVPVMLTTGSAAKRVTVPAFFAPPALVKFSLLNGAGAALGATTNTVTLYGMYEQGV